MKPQHRTALMLVAIAVISAVIGISDMREQMELEPALEDGYYSIIVSSDTVIDADNPCALLENYPRKQEICLRREQEKRNEKHDSPAQVYVDIQADIATSDGAEKQEKAATLTACNAEFGDSLQAVNTCYFSKLGENIE